MVSLDGLLAQKETLAVIGLGYVGLPLTIALAKHFKVLGFDISRKRVEELKQGIDKTREVEALELKKTKAVFTFEPEDLKQARLFIVAVPTPINKERIPDLRPILGASKLVGENLSPGSIVVYESTVYPGLTEEECVPVLEEYSSLKCGQDFWVGYSPERINPGDKEHTLATITKVVAGQTREVTELLAAVYGRVVEAGVYKASSIKVAEAAKVIENTQRDLNIALMNELALIFDYLGIDTLEVLEAAGTKWNFLPFRPGLVGGHCIGVDPYYLTFKAESLGYHPQVILAGRRINDLMGKFIAEKMVKLLVRKCSLLGKGVIGIFGLTFKENVPDLRNTKVIDIVRELEDFGLEVKVHDPLANKEEAREEYGISLSSLEEMNNLDGIILAVNHAAYQDLGPEQLVDRLKDKEKGVIIDVKGKFSKDDFKEYKLTYWRL